MILLSLQRPDGLIPFWHPLETLLLPFGVIAAHFCAGNVCVCVRVV